MIEENRRRLTALVAASANLKAASSLVKQATIDIAPAGLLQHQPLQKIATEIDVFIERIALIIEKIP